MDDERTPPPYFGDYPHGAYWSAIAPQGGGTLDDEVDAPPVEGSELRVMWDETAGPLWGEAGLLPEEPDWLIRTLGLSESVVADLLDWMYEMTALHFGTAPGARQVTHKQLQERGQQLAERLQMEVGSRYRVRHQV